MKPPQYILGRYIGDGGSSFSVRGQGRGEKEEDSSSVRWGRKGRGRWRQEVEGLPSLRPLETDIKEKEEEGLE